jgi:hypothetical protein
VIFYSIQGKRTVVRARVAEQRKDKLLGIFVLLLNTNERTSFSVIKIFIRRINGKTNVNTDKLSTNVSTFFL